MGASQVVIFSPVTILVPNLGLPFACGSMDPGLTTRPSIWELPRLAVLGAEAGRQSMAERTQPAVLLFAVEETRD